MNDRVQKVIEEKIRPYIKEHYGDIEVVSIEDGIVKVKLLGNCRGCIQAGITVENVVKEELVKEIPEIKDVLLVNDVSEELLDFAKKILRKDKQGE